MAIISRYLQHASALRKASLLRPCCRPYRTPCTRCKADNRDAAFEEWLIANGLPSQRARAASSVPPPAAAATDAAHSQKQQHEQQQDEQQQELRYERRFHWTNTPEVAARCLKIHGHLLWEARAPGVLAATRGNEEPLAARLTLPRVLAGSCPGLFLESPSHPRGQPSPLAVSPERASQQICEALQRLAAQQLSLGSSGGSSSSGSGSSSDGLVELWEEEERQQQQQQQQQAQVSVGRQLMVLLSADSAALALFQEGELARHRMLTGYTVRKQQGKAQATYQRQGGGARSVGSSIRARETRRLFQAAAATLSEWAPDIAVCNQLFRSGTVVASLAQGLLALPGRSDAVRVWNELYSSQDPPPPVDRRDPRWQPVGLGVRRPRLADVRRVYAALSHGLLEEF